MGSQRPRRAARRGRLLAGALLLVPLVAPLPAGAEEDPVVQQQRVRAQRAAAAARIDALEADQAEVAQALAALDDNLGYQRLVATEAAQDEERARNDAAAASAQERARAEEISSLEQDAKRLALQAYVGQRPEGITLILSSNLTDGIQASVLSEIVLGTVAGTVDRIDTARQDLERARDAAEVAAARAEEAKVAAQTQAAQLSDALATQQQYSAQVDDRLERELAEADALAALDAKLAGEIRARQEALAAQLRASQEAAAKAARRAGAAAPGAPSGGTRPTIVGDDAIVSVGGIRVAARIADQVAGLLAAASAAGLTLGGGGYRSSAAQIAVRQANCGSSEYDIWHKPPRQCRPPAARPGNSMHERGEAIDITCNGALIQSRSSPCFQWLAANAASYGLYNYPVEPWHWSTNGQ
jgi:LAS superfamily LD-carboxypeptidase LdcB